MLASVLLLVTVLTQVVDCRHAHKNGNVHESMDVLQLQHYFGTTNHSNVPDYWLDRPERRENADGSLDIALTVDGARHTFHLKRNHDLMGGDLEDDSECVWQGGGVEDEGASISLVGCGPAVHGLIVTSSGEYVLVQPHVERADEQQHVIHKRSLKEIDERHECLFDSSKDPYPEDRIEITARRRRDGRRYSPMSYLQKSMHSSSTSQWERYRGNRATKKPPLLIELAVFADDAMWMHFEKLYGQAASTEMRRFVIASVNNIDILFSSRSIEPKINVRIVKYEVMRTTPAALHPNVHRSGDVDRLLDAFCAYQHGLNPPDDNDPRHWDHALLFSGYDLYRDGLKTVAGYAPVKGMCSGVRSCTINEGLDFGAVFVVTHEMGHSLGMYHDGDNGCDQRCCIMSPSVGTGKTGWSSCSVDEYNTFVDNLGYPPRPPNCLVDTMKNEKVFDRSSPGQSFSLHSQCEVFHGECWKHELRDDQTNEDVCSMLWCGNGEGIIRTAHPALEGSHCGNGKWCRGGRCVPAPSSLAVTHGGWSEWNDRPAGSCSPSCTPCVISGQISLRRSTRQCNSPYPNNGGAQCLGDSTKGLPCKSDLCHGVSPESFANATCIALRDDRDNPNPQFSGAGLQFEQAPCKIWCQFAYSNNIRTVANFPDGTPCGDRRFCVKGECRPLQCNGYAVVDRAEDCPVVGATSTNRVDDLSAPSPSGGFDPLFANRFEDSARRTDGENSITDGAAWSDWSHWSQCISIKCDEKGLQVRVRRCASGYCSGPRRQRRVCQGECEERTTVAPTTQAAPRWQQQQKDGSLLGRRLSLVSPSQLRSNASLPSLPSNVLLRQPLARRVQSISTTTVPPTTATTARMWWTTTTGTPRNVILTGVRPRVVDGAAQITQPRPTSRVPTATDSWSVWSGCSVSCGQGWRRRVKRKCGSGPSCSESERCELRACPPSPHSPNPSKGEWKAWSGWGVCSRSCDGGMQQRIRVCGSEPCTGEAKQTKPCNQQRCSIDASGAFTGWSVWSECSVSCGGGERHRRRRCIVRDCAGIGPDSETESCSRAACPLSSLRMSPRKSEWAQWGEWASCSTTCGQGWKLRRRQCPGGNTCTGDGYKYEKCELRRC